jgi:hypothetical protein
MAYDEQLAARIRDVLAAEKGVTERRMFGGLQCWWMGAWPAASATT